MTMPTTPEHTDPHGECAAEIARLREQLRQSQLREAVMRDALFEARDTLLERIHGNPARSAGHNARLVIQRALSHPALEGKT